MCPSEVYLSDFEEKISLFIRSSKERGIIEYKIMYINTVLWILKKYIVLKSIHFTRTYNFINRI